MKLKSLMIVALVAGLAGCSSATPMAELERQAIMTGDWSAVERRERILVRKNMARGMACPSGYIGYCDASMGREQCSCVERDVIRAALTR